MFKVPLLKRYQTSVNDATVLPTASLFNDEEPTIDQSVATATMEKINLNEGKNGSVYSNQLTNYILHINFNSSVVWKFSV